ncbi:uncharacterized protein B0H64DRAFT_429217 [Chaetomium fimeti]|uniref:rRNA methyltransferase 1, mitochondrial n=1 Tax=Chaetomium fimeti TaxID=1854472 RepID=A0AAE0HRE4_9PEZI|nr:hypothetical protein B0H64DRAFT_429217 [Chaetomium fimeti]
MSLSLVYRAARGLVRSEQTRPQGARPNRFNDLAEGGKRLNYAERRKAREQLAKERPTFKIRKGKKDITEHPEKARPKSRQARFYDPNSSFGKKSLVYKMQAVNLGEDLNARRQKASGSADSPFERTGPRPDLPLPRRTVKNTTRGRDSKRDRDTGDVADFVAELSRPAGSSTDAPRRDAAPRQHRDSPPRARDSFRGRDAFPRDRGGFGDRDGPPRARDSFRGRDAFPRDRGSFGDRAAPRRDRDAPRGDRDTPRGDGFRDRDTRSGDRDTSFRTRDSPRGDRDTDGGFGDVPRPERDTSFTPRRDREPLTVTYTTAASQFLYGKSVVEAALRSSRRQFYHLYIYGGANRQKPTNDALIQALAKRKNIPITILGEDGMRLLDKMASSRPHNGFVLEASPLPQPPLTALAPLPDDYTTNPRCAVTLAHQSAEEAAINGAPATVPTPSPSHKPLILVLDQILDPGNLGAILRTASFLGATAVGITRKGSATLTPVALKASSGAAESLTLFSVGALPEFLNESRANGWAVYAAVADGPSGAKQRRHVDVRDVSETDPLKREPCVLLVGNEGEGLARLVVKKADYEVNIPNLAVPGSGVDSLNVKETLW